VKSRDKQVRGH